MFCKKCGAKIREGSQFCRNCGAPVEQQRSEQQGQSGVHGNLNQNIQQNVQQNLNQNMRQNAQQNLNQNMQQNVQQNLNQNMQKNTQQNSNQNMQQNLRQNQPQQTKKKGPKPWVIAVMIGAGVVLIAAAVLVVLFVYKSAKNDADSDIKNAQDMQQEDRFLADDTEADTDIDSDAQAAANNQTDETTAQSAGMSEEEYNAMAIAAAADVCVSGQAEAIDAMPWLEMQKEAAWTIAAADALNLFYQADYIDVSQNSTAFLQRQSAVDGAVLECGLRPYSIKTKEDVVVADVELLGVKSEAVSLLGLYRVVWRNSQTLTAEDGNTVDSSAADNKASGADTYGADAEKYVLVGAKKLTEDVQIVSADATSTLVDSADTSKYAPANVYDHSMMTAWVEGAGGLGEGESITLNLPTDSKVHGIRIAPGYDKNSTTISENATPVKLRLEFSDGTVVTADLSSGNYDDDLLCAADTRCIVNHAQSQLLGLTASSWNTARDLMDIVSFGKEIQTSWIKVTILTVDAGTDWEDTCISEISVY